MATNGRSAAVAAGTVLGTATLPCPALPCPALPCPALPCFCCTALPRLCCPALASAAGRRGPLALEHSHPGPQQTGQHPEGSTPACARGRQAGRQGGGQGSQRATHRAKGTVCRGSNSSRGSGKPATEPQCAPQTPAQTSESHLAQMRPTFVSTGNSFFPRVSSMMQPTLLRPSPATVCSRGGGT